MTTDMGEKRKPKRKKVIGPFSKNLGLILSERSLSQKQAANIMGVRVSVMNDWLNGVYPHDPQPLLRFCKAIGCDFQWLLTGEQSQLRTNANLNEVFDIQDDATFSGIFMIEAKRLKVRDSGKK